MKHFIITIVVILSVATCITSSESCRKTPRALALEYSKQRTPVQTADIDNLLAGVIKKTCELPPGCILFQDSALCIIDCDSLQGIVTSTITHDTYTDSIWLAWNRKGSEYLEFSRFIDTSCIVSFKKDMGGYEIYGEKEKVFDNLENFSELLDN